LPKTKGVGPEEKNFRQAAHRRLVPCRRIKLGKALGKGEGGQDAAPVLKREKIFLKNVEEAILKKKTEHASSSCRGG